MGNVVPRVLGVPEDWAEARPAIERTLSDLLEEWRARPRVELRQVWWVGGDTLTLQIDRDRPPVGLLAVRATERLDPTSQATPTAVLDWAWDVLVGGTGQAVVQSPSGLAGGTEYQVTLMVIG